MSHMEWADSTLWSAIRPSEATDSKLFVCLHHIHLVQHAFLSLWRGEALELPEPSTFADAAALAEWGREAHGDIQRFVATAESQTLERVLEIPWTEELTARLRGPIASVSVQQSVLQVAMHSVHHRGQVALLLRDLEVKPPMFDFIVWLWRGRPQAEWPEPGAD